MLLPKARKLLLLQVIDLMFMLILVLKVILNTQYSIASVMVIIFHSGDKQAAGDRSGGQASHTVGDGEIVPSKRDEGRRSQACRTDQR